MRQRLGLWLRLGALGALAGGVAIAAPHMALGADHVDSPAAVAEPTADINDMFAWMTSDGNDLNLVATVVPFASGDSAFSDATTYAFHVNSSAGYGMAQTNTDVRCQFYSDTNIECWVIDADGTVAAYVEGDPSDSAGLTNAAGNLRVFAGVRNDPFFFNLGGFNAVVGTVREVAGSLTFDAEGCPQLDEPTATALVTQLQQDPDGSEATDDFAGANVLALVVQVDKTLVNPGGDILGVWASTHSAE